MSRDDAAAAEDAARPPVIRPSFRARTPFLLHFDDQTVALGDAHLLQQIEANLLAADRAPRTTFWDQAYLSGEEGALFAPDPDPEHINSVGITGGAEEFWAAMDAAVFQQTEWPREETATVWFPEYPAWLRETTSWTYDPICPPMGPGAPGGWVRTRSVPGEGRPVGLFQLTDRDAFWVFGAAQDLRGIVALCGSLARFRRGFDALTAYAGPDDVLGSLALPLICREALQEELMVRGVDVETLFWE